MSLAPGNRLGPYEILTLLGSGGMGEVYRAKDTRLDRTVAIKILPAHLSADPLFRERFDREARTISKLDHPHICALYDVGEENGTAFLVMPCLEGETLADRLRTGALPFDQALDTAIQIADALHNAHRAGIVHRDLKPGNVMLTRAGAASASSPQAVLLDFGLAKSASVGARTGGSITAANLTSEGTILGTFQYMAPEQLEGRDADPRADIFAFGAVLYEMLTGRKAFEANSQAGLVSAIMSSEPPPVSSGQTLAPASLDHLVARCLAKDPEERWQSSRDLTLQLSWIAETGLSPAALRVQRTPSRERLAWILAIGALVAVAGLLLTVLRNGRAPAAQIESTQFVVLPPEKTSFSTDMDSQALSRDGRQIAFVAGAAGESLLWIRPLDSVTARPLAGTNGASQPFWSPDGRWLGFFAGGKLKKIDVAGGVVQTLADASFPLGGAWGPDDVIVFGSGIGSPLLQIPASGRAEPTRATTLDATQRMSTHANPAFLPDGRHFLFFAATGPATGDLYVGSLDSKDVKPIFREDSIAVYVPPGYLLFVRKSMLMAQRFDVARLATSGEAFRLADNVGLRGFAASDNGNVVIRSAVSGQTQLVWVSRGGTEHIETPPGSYEDISLSTDDTRVTFARVGPSGLDIWRRDLDRGPTMRVTSHPPLNNVPLWSADGRTIVFATARNGGLDLYQRPSNLSAPDEALLTLNATPILFPSDWSADGRYLAYYRTDPRTRLDMWVLPLVGDRNPVPFLRGDFNESQGQFSPDGRWLAYVSDESGEQQINVESFPVRSGLHQISTEGGTQPRWRGKELFFLAPDRKLMAVTVRAGATFEAEAPHVLFQTELDVNALRQMYCVSADGQRFLLNTPVNTKAPPMTVILNWPALVKKP